jgi:DNA-binding transcriptional ArsR family regulator
MGIRLRIDPQRPELVRVHRAPLMEAVISLHVLLYPKRHPLQHPWIRGARSLSTDLKKEIRAFAFLYDDALPDCFLPASADSAPSFEEALAAFRALSGKRAGYELGRPLFHYADPDMGGEEALSREHVQERIRFTSARYGDESARLGELLLVEPDAVQERVAGLLAAYWEQAFAGEWDRLEPVLVDETEQARRDVAEDSVFSLLEQLRPELLVDRGFGLAVRRSGHHHEVVVSEENPLLLLPSVYVWPHVRVNCDAPWPLAIVYPARFLLELGGRKPAPDRLAAVARAVGDPIRLDVLRLVAESARTTEELAPLVGLSESGLSRHLRLLTDAGFLTAKRDGWYVLYSLRRERLAALSAELLGYVDNAIGPDAEAPGP